MTYRLTIERLEPNPAYDPEAERRRYINQWNETSVPATIQCNVLNMEISAEQFEAIRRAALEVCK